MLRHRHGHTLAAERRSCRHSVFPAREEVEAAECEPEPTATRQRLYVGPKLPVALDSGALDAMGRLARTHQQDP